MNYYTISLTNIKRKAAVFTFHYHQFDLVIALAEIQKTKKSDIFNVLFEYHATNKRRRQVEVGWRRMGAK